MTDGIVSLIAKYNGMLNGIVWGVPMIALILFVGISYAIKTKFFQITHFKEVYDNTIKGILTRKEDDTKANAQAKVLSQFQALSTALASTIGTGNIAGVSTAIAVGGPGAIFWMWICAIFGMGTHFIEIVLGIYYRSKDEKNGGYNGGPMYYLEKGVGKQLGFKTVGKVLAVLFCIFLFIASYGTGNMTQINSISDALKTNFGIPTLVCGIVLAAATSLIVFGGITRIGKTAERIVPFMAIFYLVIGIILVILNVKNVPIAFASIFQNAFSTKAIAGGALGIVLKRAMVFGFKRGAFSNEAGLGTSVIAHSASNEKEPVKQGLWGIFEVFFDTIIVCTFTALIILTSTINAPSLQNTINNLTIDEKTVCINNISADSSDKAFLVNNEVEKMLFKLDMNGNAKTYAQLPNDGKNYTEIVAYGNKYYVETLEDKDASENECFFGNVLKIKANPVLHTNKEPLLGEDGNPIIDSIHVENISGVSLVTLAISTKLSHWAGKILAIAVSLFAFTTVLGWSYYGSQSVEYLFGKVATYVYKVVFIIFIVIGATMNLSLAWDIADTMNGLMAIPNLIGVLLLSSTALSIVKNYYDRKAGKDVKPMVSFDEEHK